MYNTLSDQCQKPITNLRQHIDALIFINLFVGFHDFSDVAITKLLDDVVIFATFHNVDKLDDVGVMDRLHDFDLLK